MRTGRLLAAGRTADVYELHADEGESGPHGPDGLAAASGTAAPGGPADRDGADRHTGRGADRSGGRGADGNAGHGADGCTGRDGAWVLRRYRDGRGDAVAEAEVMEYVRSHGYPVPRVRSATRTEMVLERLTGPTMLEAFAAGLIDPVAAGATLARLLHALHAVPPRTHPAFRLLHLDLHPENVVLAPHGPQVIDWNNAEEGPPGLDWGVSAMILAQVAVDEDDPRAHLAHDTLVSLLAQRPDGPAALTEGGLAEARRRRAANPTMSAREVELVGPAEQLIRRIAGPGPTA
ncbi:phosphotransferase [Streptomyces sp. ATCC 21386]|uniref:phosphotransferase n=1 Tax=Streptomyces sp. ATCC 21386 TaxID=2699428 RepID=UPI001BFF7C55|nr:phosphotransferase [Streptomyces sp. ATCC 21386]